MVAVQLPGAFGVDQAVARVDDRAERLQGGPEVEIRQGPVDSGRDVGVGRRRDDPAGAVLVHQREDAVDQVSEAVRQVLVVALDEPVDREVGVPHGRHVPQQPPANRVRAVPVGERHRVDRVAGTLGQLRTVDGQVVVHEDRRRQRPARRQQQGQPVDRVEPDDALADHVDALVGALPPAGVQVAVAERGQIVGQGVPPDVDDLVGVVRHGHTPATRAGGRPGDAEVLESGADECQRLVAPGRRVDAYEIGLEDLENLIFVAGEPEEPVALGDRLGRGEMLGAAAVDQLGGGVELLAAGAVEALVAAQIKIRGALAPELLDAGSVPRVGAGPDEVVERQVERPAQGGEPGRVGGDERADVLARSPGRGHVLQRVVVRAGQEADRLAAQPPVPGEHIGLHQLERMTQMRGRVDVRNGGRQIGRHGCLPPPAAGDEPPPKQGLVWSAHAE